MRLETKMAFMKFFIPGSLQLHTNVSTQFIQLFFVRTGRVYKGVEKIIQLFTGKAFNNLLIVLFRIADAFFLILKKENPHHII